MVKRIFNYAIVLLAILFSFPLLLTIICSFTVDYEQFGFESYKELLFNCFSFYPVFWNSVFYTVIITIAQLLVIIPAAFAFYHLRTRIKNAVYLFYIVLMMMPLQVTLLPVYIGLRDMNLLDTRGAIILPMIFAPASVVILIQYMRNIDTSVMEAVRLESNSVVRIILTGVLPQIKPCLISVAILSMAETWNMLEQPMMFLKDEELMPLSVFINEASVYGNIILFPAAVISMVPMLLAYGYFNKSVKQGLS